MPLRGFAPWRFYSSSNNSSSSIDSSYRSGSDISRKNNACYPSYPRPFPIVCFVLDLQFKMKDKGTSDLKKLEDQKAPGTLFTAAPATTANEAFRRVQEDPLLRMR